jgi:putative membrane protein
LGFLRKLLAWRSPWQWRPWGVLFALQNPDPVPLDVLIMTLPPRSLALWVLGALALGGVLGLRCRAFAMLRLRARLIAARRQIASAQVELDRQRTRDLATRG